MEGEAYRHVDDLAALLKHLGIASAHIVGLSMGSGIAVDFALAYPAMTRSLVAVGPWVSGFDCPSAAEMWEGFKQVKAALQEQGPAAAGS